MRRTPHASAVDREEGVRAFVALPLSDQCGQAISSVMAAMRLLAGDAWRFVSAQNLHITLRFLGSIPADKVDDVHRACVKSVRNTPCLSLELSGIGVFPNMHRPSVLWAGLRGDTVLLQRLAAALEAELLQAGFAPADKPFRPHITIARCKERHSSVDVEQLMAVGSNLQAHWQAKELVLYRSVLRPAGPTYTALGTALLQSEE